MLARLGLGVVAWWEMVSTMALMMVAIFAAWFAARLYRLSVLMYGQRPGL